LDLRFTSSLLFSALLLQSSWKQSEEEAICLPLLHSASAEWLEAKQSKTKQSKAKQSKAKQSKAKQSKAKKERVSICKEA
jgi:hypothetical protein